MRTCPDCHTQVDERAAFCDHCGCPLSPGGKEASPPSAVGKNLAHPHPGLKTGQDATQPSGGGASASLPQGTCSACGFVNFPGEMFCQRCGVQLAPVISAPPPPPTPVSKAPPARSEASVLQAGRVPGRCLHCGYENQPSDQYCQNCGVQLSLSAKALAEDPGPAAPPASMTLPSSASRAAEGKVARADLQMPSGKLIILDTGVELPLSFKKAELVIGRSDPARNIYPDIDLASHRGETFGVSRAHARLVSQGLQIYIEDLNSTNFTFLNQKRLQPGQRYPLKPGDEVRLGLLAMKYLTG